MVVGLKSVENSQQIQCFMILARGVEECCMRVLYCFSLLIKVCARVNLLSTGLYPWQEQPLTLDVLYQFLGGLRRDMVKPGSEAWDDQRSGRNY